MHINKKDLIEFDNGNMNTQEVIEFLSHLDHCDFCLDQMIKQEDSSTDTAPAYLMEQIARPGGEMLLVGVDVRHYSCEERLHGFAEYFRERDTDVSHVIYGKGSHELTYRQTHDMIAERENISGIFVSGAGLSGAAHAVDDYRAVRFRHWPSGCSAVVRIFDLNAGVHE